MPKTPKHFRKITFDWPIPSVDRQKIEEFLRSNAVGYDVDGGISSPETGTAEIFIRPKARSHKRRTPAPSAG